jgi:hypothetical protein
VSIVKRVERVCLPPLHSIKSDPCFIQVYPYLVSH